MSIRFFGETSSSNFAGAAISEPSIMHVTGTNRLLLFFVHVTTHPPADEFGNPSSADSSCAGATVNGGAATLLASDDIAGVFTWFGNPALAQPWTAQAQLYGFVNPPPGNVTLQLSGTGPAVLCSAMCATGVDQTDPYGSVFRADGSSQTISAPVTAASEDRTVGSVLLKNEHSTMESFSNGTTRPAAPLVSYTAQSNGATTHFFTSYEGLVVAFNGSHDAPYQRYEGEWRVQQIILHPAVDEGEPPPVLVAPTRSQVMYV